MTVKTKPRRIAQVSWSLYSCGILTEMNVIFSNHALLKMQQRKLSKRTVVAVIANPDRMENTYSRREALYKKFHKRALKVVLVREDGRVIVVTTHWVA